MKEKLYGEGEVIFREGEEQSVMYDVRRGAVGIYARHGTADQRRLTELRTGRYFGEMGMLEHAPRSAAAVALEEGTLVAEISEAEFGDYIREQPEQVLAIMRNLSGRLRELTGEYGELCGVIAELESAWGGAPEKKKGFLAALKARLKHYAAVYDESAAAVSQANDVFYWTTMINAQF